MGKLNLPTLLFRVGLLTLINMDSLIYLDKFFANILHLDAYIMN